MLEEHKAQLKTAGRPDWIRLIPGWVPANAISLLRALLIVPIYLAARAGAFWWVAGLFGLAWLTDLLDGRHARYRGQISRLGKLLDPAADKVLVAGLLLIIGPGHLTPAVIAVTLGLEVAIVLLTGLAGPLIAHRTGLQIKLGANRWGKAKMFLQGCGLTLLIVGLKISVLNYAAEGLLWAAALLALISLIFYTGEIKKTG